MYPFFLLTLFFLVSNLGQGNINNQAVLGAQKERISQEKIKTPLRNPNQIGVKLDAEAAISLDVETGTVLFAKNEKDPLPIASLTKLMTSLVVLSSAKYNPLDEVEISRRAALLRWQGADIQLQEGEVVLAGDLLRGVLMASGNDASLALAEYIGGNEADFVSLMDQKARDLGLKNTHFINPHGLDTPHHYASAYDLALITQRLLEFPEFLQIIGSEEYEFDSVYPPRHHFFKNTNKLLTYPFLNILGGKTGFTDEARFCLMLVGEKEGHKIINVVLGSSDAFQDSKVLMDWVVSVYQWTPTP